MTLCALTPCCRLAVLLLACVLAGGGCPALAQRSVQGSVVAPGPEGVLRVNGEPLYPIGWAALGTCLERDWPGYDRYAVRRDTLVAQLERLRRIGVNVIIEPPHANGRNIAHFASPDVSNWYSLSYTDVEGNHRNTGHPRPGAYVESLLTLMDRAVGPRGGSAIYTLVTLAAFVTPSYTGSPYSGNDRLTCSEYSAFIEAERAAHAETAPERAARIPISACDAQRPRPFWEWNVWYIVTSLRDHPGLLGWYLWDEPEGITHRHLFGLTAPEALPPPYTGPESLPTPDLLRYVYDRVRTYEAEGRPPSYQRHPVVVDIVYPPAFFSTEQFAWAKLGLQAWNSGPFDRLPDGGYHVPADLLGQEASAFWVHTSPRGEASRHRWIWDPSLVSRRAAELQDAAERYGLWGALVVAAQAQLPTDGAYRPHGPFPCRDGDTTGRTRLLNDRDLVWTFMTPQINGLRGSIFYAHSLLPLTGPGAEQRRRTYQLQREFREAGLNRVFQTPRLPTSDLVGAITVHALTNYYRSDPGFIGPATEYDPGLSHFSVRRHFDDPAAYNASFFGRSEDEAGYGHAAHAEQYQPEFPGHRFLRTSLHRYDGALYLFLSNVYDARITAELVLPEHLQVMEEGSFDLDPDGTFAWAHTPPRLRYSRGSRSAEVDLEPYEVRMFRITPRR
jgi:hypothetical protein